MAFVFDRESQMCWALLGALVWLIILGVAALLGLNKANTFDALRDMNGLTDVEAFGMLFGQPICALVAFAALEIREDLILNPVENALRGVGTEWPRHRVYSAIYIEYPIWWAASFGLFMAVGGPATVFSSYAHEPWAVWMLKMVCWFTCWEFIMYSAHRLWHSVPWLYAIAHKGHHVVMDFPLGPHAPALEKLSNYAATIVASKVVGVSAGSWVLARDILMTQCVLEHAFSSLKIPIWHSFFAFNTADIHQTHHVKNNVNFGYAFNIFDPLFGTLESELFSKPQPSLSGLGTPARIRFLNRGRVRQALAPWKVTEG